MNRSKSKIPGNKFSEFGRIYSDTTVEALSAHRQKLVRNQQANMRGNARYVREVRRLARAIEQAGR